MNPGLIPVVVVEAVLISNFVDSIAEGVVLLAAAMAGAVYLVRLVRRGWNTLEERLVSVLRSALNEELGRISDVEKRLEAVEEAVTADMTIRHELVQSPPR